MALRFHAATRPQEVRAPAGSTVYTRDSESRLLGISLPSEALNTMQYRADNPYGQALRTRLQDEEGDRRQVWDSMGSSGCQDLFQEWTQ